MSNQKTHLTFEATIAAIKPVMSKGDAFNGTPGHLDITLSIPQPEPPRKPRIPYGYGKSSSAGEVWKSRPRDDKPDEQKLYDKVRSGYDEEMRTYQRTLELQQRRTLMYAQLVGVAAVFGDHSVQVSITPNQQDLLSGFGLDLLALPEPIEAEAVTVEEEDDAA